MANVLEVRGLNKSFGGIVVARNVDLNLHSGRVVGLIGPNGAGKTSLFNLISGVVRPDAGTVLLNGAVLDGKAFHQRVSPALCAPRHTSCTGTSPCGRKNMKTSTSPVNSRP